MASPTTSATDLTRRERRKLEVHTRILEAAVALFEKRGPRETTVVEICERADVAHKTFFNHFPTKQHLLRAIAEASIEELLVDIEEIRKQPGSTRLRIERFFARIADNAEAAGPMHRELLTEIIYAAHEAGTEAQQARRLHAAFEGLVGEGAASGDLTRHHDVKTLTEMVQGAFYVLMFNFANLEDYPLRRRALAAARFLGDAMTDVQERSDS
jgi:AcrR family transcriptional regulator